MGRWFHMVVATAFVVAATPAQAEQLPARCVDALQKEGVEFNPTRRSGVESAVEIHGPLGGVDYQSYGNHPLVIDCSLAYSLARSGRFLRAHGIESVKFSSAYQRRKIRGTNRWSKHSFGLAIDVHSFVDADGTMMQVRDDYEQGLGDQVDCIGQPLTKGGEVLRTLTCQLARSDLFRIVLDPDYDADHYNHFHVEALPWSERRMSLR